MGLKFGVGYPSEHHVDRQPWPQGKGRSRNHFIPLFSKSKPASCSRRPPGWKLIGGATPRPGRVQAFQVERFNFISSPRGDQALGNQPSKVLIDKPDQQFINLCWQL